MEPVRNSLFGHIFLVTKVIIALSEFLAIMWSMTVTLKANLKVLRIHRGLTMRMCAAQIGVSQRAYSEAEHGYKPSYDTAAAIAKFYGKRLDEIWGYEP